MSRQSEVIKKKQTKLSTSPSPSHRFLPLFSSPYSLPSKSVVLLSSPKIFHSFSLPDRHSPPPITDTYINASINSNSLVPKLLLNLETSILFISPWSSWFCSSSAQFFGDSTRKYWPHTVQLRLYVSLRISDFFLL